MNELEIKKLQEDVESLKKEIQELKKENLHRTDVGADFDFNKYKDIVNEEDLKKMLGFKYRFVWFIPVIGLYWFSADLQINLESVDRGLVRSELTRAQWHFVLLLIPVAIISVFINIMPFFEIQFIRKVAAKRIRRKMRKNDE